MNPAGPEMPDWASKEGPWCLKAWLRLPSPPGAGYTLCVRDPDHPGSCMDWLNVEHAAPQSLFLGDHSSRQGDTMIKKTVQITGEHQHAITLGQVRRLLEELAGAPDSAQLALSENRYAQRDPGPDRITVTWEDTKP